MLEWLRGVLIDLLKAAVCATVQLVVILEILIRIGLNEWLRIL